VTTAAEEQDGGTSAADPTQAGPTLSLWEALTIAYNRPGYDVITFDSSVFPPSQRTVISVSGALPFALQTEAYCLSGAGAGVALVWDASLDIECWTCVFSVPAGSLVVGLELVNLPSTLDVNAAQVAGCSFSNIRYVACECGANALIGPENMFSGSGTGVRNSFYAGLVVRGNYFGFDPRTSTNRALSQAVVLFSPALVEQNTFGGEITYAVSSTTQGTEPTVLRNNRWGVAPDGSILGSAGPHLRAYGNPSRWVIGPGNIIAHSTAAGIVLFPGSSDFVEITANSIYDNMGAGIEAGDTTFLPPAPVITTVTATDVSGTCADSGRVELFADRGDEGELYLGSVECTAGLWSLVGEVPAGFNATATLTDGQGRTSVFSGPVAAP